MGVFEGFRVGEGVGVRVGLRVGVGVGVRVGQRVLVGVGVREYQGVRVGVRVRVGVNVGGKVFVGEGTGVAVFNASRGYTSIIADNQSSPPVLTNSSKRAAEKANLHVDSAGSLSHPYARASFEKSTQYPKGMGSSFPPCS